MPAPPPGPYDDLVRIFFFFFPAPAGWSTTSRTGLAARGRTIFFFVGLSSPRGRHQRVCRSKQRFKAVSSPFPAPSRASRFEHGRFFFPRRGQLRRVRALCFVFFFSPWRGRTSFGFGRQLSSSFSRRFAAFSAALLITRSAPPPFFLALFFLGEARGVL